MNIKKGLLQVLIFSTAILTIGTSVAAGAETSTTTSQGSITITAGNSATDPIDPSDPSGETGNSGPLSIDNVSPLLFDTHQLAGGKVTYTTTTTNPNVQVTDTRGTGAGWTLQVSATPFKDKTENTKVLKGATVTLPAGSLVTTPANISTAPEARIVELSTDTDKTAPQNLMVAKGNTGLGTWVDKFNASNVTIDIPAGNLAGDYTSTLYWSLLDAPQ
ncbi:MAG TPA: WxL domain-containing protein [Paenibacillus sp.]|jgi:hypothetical protein